MISVAEQWPILNQELRLSKVVPYFLRSGFTCQISAYRRTVHPQAGVGRKDVVRPGLIKSANYTRTLDPQTLKELRTFVDWRFMVQKLVRRLSFFDTCLSVCLSTGLIILYCGSYLSSSVVYCSNTHLSVAIDSNTLHSVKTIDDHNDDSDTLHSVKIIDWSATVTR